MLTWRAYANYAEWLFSLRKRLRGDTFAIFCYATDYADYAVDLAYTTLYMKHTNYADYADKINLHVTTRDYAGLRGTTQDYALQARGYASTLAVSWPS